MIRRDVLPLLVAAVLLCSAAHAADPWYESYASALKAISQRNWGNAEAKLKLAIKDGPPPGRGVRTYGVRFVDYLPDFYLGVVYFNQQRYGEALETLLRVQTTSQVKKGDPEYQQLADMLELTSMRVAGSRKPNEGQKEAETLIRFARDLLAQDSLEEARRAFESARQKDPGHSGLQSLGDAIAKKDAERKAKADDDVRKREAARRSELDGALESARQLVSARRYKDARDAVARARASGINDPRFDEVLASADFGEGLAELQALVTRKDWEPARQKAASLASRHPNDPELQRLRGILDKTVVPETASAKPALAAGANELEGTALRAFYAGKYQTAADILGELAEGKSRSARVMFYLACSNSALGLLQGKDGEPLLEKARQQLIEVKKLDPRFKLEGRLVSPRVLAALQR